MRISKTVERWFEVPEDSDKAELKIKHLTPGEEANVFDEAFKQEIKAKALYEVMKKRFPDSYKPELKKISDAYTKRISTNNLIALQQEMQDASTEQETMEMV